MSSVPHSRLERIAAVRAAVKAVEAKGNSGRNGILPFGLPVMDRRLEGGGLACAALHEIAAAAPEPAGEAAATLFIAGIAGRTARAREGMVLWSLRRRDLFAPALAQAGLSPRRLIYAECGGEEDVLAVMEEGLRHGALAAVVGEAGRVTMAAARRLQLAAEEGGTTALLLKLWRRSGEDPLLLPSTAMTRWRIGCVSSAALPVPGVGRARWHVSLVRQRGGEPFDWILESPDAEGRLALPAPSAHRPIAAEQGRAAA